MKMKRKTRRDYPPPTGGPGGRAGVLKKRTGVHMDTPSRPLYLNETLPQGPAPASPPALSMDTFDTWSMQRLSEENPCLMEETYTCVPLQDDPVCRACWQTLREEDGGGH
jgi:hypothetical protein